MDCRDKETVEDKQTWYQLEDVYESPIGDAFEGTFACEVEGTKSIKHISKNILKSSKIHDYNTC